MLHTLTGRIQANRIVGVASQADGTPAQGRVVLEPRDRTVSAALGVVVGTTAHEVDLNLDGTFEVRVEPGRYRVRAPGCGTRFFTMPDPDADLADLVVVGGAPAAPDSVEALKARVVELEQLGGGTGGTGDPVLVDQTAILAALERASR